jgi:hypothetical protein
MNIRAAKKQQRAAVEKGARLLDKRHPRWFEQIDLDNFDLSSGQYCICGQLDAIHRGVEIGRGSWAGALRRVFGRDVNVSKKNSRDETHGFCVPWQISYVFDGHGLSGWGYTEGIWKTEIRKRRRAKAAA